jgi:desulfoferrodoxin-like iron-binding protein
MNDFFKCSQCGKIVKVIYDGQGELVCCRQPMKMLATFQSLQEILDFAMEKEDEAREFYLDWSKKLENPALREVFVTFAGEEAKHKEKIQRIKSGGTLSSSAKPVTDLKIVDYLVDISPTPEIDYQEALIIAMKREKASFKLYNDLASKTDDSQIQALFVSLAQEEAKHKLRLETEYEKEIYQEN